MVVIFQSSGCTNTSTNSEMIVPKISEIIEFGEKKYVYDFTPIAGCYISKEDTTGKKTTISIKKNHGNNFQLKLSSGKQHTKQAFTLDMNLKKKNDSLYTSMIKGKKILLSLDDKMLSIKPEKPEDIEVLTICWSWGTSLAGDYEKIEGSLGGR
ncbi:hypothetical protein C8P64_2586 [Christiangramia gaetbulicola]|uniref:Uncharacterized protein n=2 Tax=Christiangramia gaetbulicola TaxID=703340 RepID=A0A2T6AEE7_9FLAO|nr:hypothetical protein C8P64_2586 [Christiangramia gaetbulicola]